MLTPLELDIMKAVWRSHPITVRDVQDSIRPSRNLAYTTVMTIMDRLYHKGSLGRTLHLRTHHYEPTIDFADVRDEAVEMLITNFFGSKEKLQEFLQGEPASLPARIVSEPTSAPNFDETLL
jgi:predicted transcriptional regulator